MWKVDRRGAVNDLDVRCGWSSVESTKLSRLHVSSWMPCLHVCSILA